MSRKDGKKVPVCYIPNGSGDDAAGGIGIPYNNIERALSYVRKGNTIKHDVVKVILDHETEEELDKNLETNPAYKDLQKKDFLRYMIINSSLCLSADVARNC